MENKKIHTHALRRVFYDILRDKYSSKYSITKFSAFIGLILLFATVVLSLIIMWNKQEVDHILFLELLGFVLTLLGFKNNFGARSSDSIPNTNEKAAQEAVQEAVEEDIKRTEDIKNDNDLRG